MAAQVQVCSPVRCQGLQRNCQQTAHHIASHSRNGQKCGAWTNLRLRGGTWPHTNGFRDLEKARNPSALALLPHKRLSLGQRLLGLSWECVQTPPSFTRQGHSKQGPTDIQFFKEAASLRSSETECERVENLVDTALYFIGEAFPLLKEALAIQPDNFILTANNMAVCHLRRLSSTWTVFSWWKVPPWRTTSRSCSKRMSSWILNLTTIYQLHSSDGLNNNQLLKLISEYKGDGVNSTSLKMPNLILTFNLLTTNLFMQ